MSFFKFLFLTKTLDIICDTHKTTLKVGRTKADHLGTLGPKV